MAESLASAGRTPKGGGGSLMSKKLMGLPVPVWIGVAVGGLLLGLYLRHRASSSSGGTDQTSAPPLSTSPSGGTGDSGSITGGVAGGGVAPASPGIDPATVQNLLSGYANVITGEQQQEQNLTDLVGALIYQIGSSGGSGASGGNGGGGSPSPTTSPPPVTKPQPTPKVKVPAAAPAKLKQTPTTPYAVHVTANPTGGSANKKQGTYAIH